MGREFTQQTTPDLFSTDAQCRQLPSLDQVQEQKTNSTMQFLKAMSFASIWGPCKQLPTRLQRLTSMDCILILANAWLEAERSKKESGL
jgi:hypothetical protein